MNSIWLLPVFLLDTLPFTYFMYVSLRNDLRYKISKSSFFLWLVATTAVSCVFFALTYLPFYNHDMLRFLRLGCTLVFLGLVLISIKTNRAKAALVFSLIIPFSIGFSVISAFISQFIRGNTPLYMVSSLVRFFIILLLYPFMVWMWRKIGKEADRITDTTVWKYLWLIPASSAVSEMVLMDRNFETQGISLTDMLGRVVLWIGSIALCWLLFFLAHRFELRIHLQDLNERNEMLLSLQKQQYIDLADSVERTRAARHDLRHHLNALKSMSDNKEYDKLSSYISEIIGHLPSESRIKICENYAANAVLDNYIRKAREMEIPIKVSFRLSNESGISDADLCVLLGNSVENALEAASKVLPEKRFISISALEENDRIYMTFDNSFDGDVRKNDNGFLSQKRGFASTGIGITSINAVIKKYDGDMKIEAEDNVFRLSVMINKKGLSH